MTAAVTLARHGIDVVLIEDQATLGGQYFRMPPSALNTRAGGWFTRHWRRGRRLIRKTLTSGVDVLCEATAWTLDDNGDLAFSGPGETGRVKADFVILSTGAYDRPFPVPGWTLPGVLSAGGMLNLIKGQRLAPEGTSLVVGHGALLLAVAHELIHAGARVAAVVDCGPARLRWRDLAGLIATPGMAVKALGYRWALARAGVRYLRCHRLERISRADGRMMVHLRSGENESAERIIAADHVVMGFGLAPSTEMARLFGCRQHEDTCAGSPVRNAAFETSVRGTFVVGDGARIAGGEMAMAEGRLAALEIVHRRRGDSLRLRLERWAARMNWRRLDRFRAVVENTFGPLPAIDASATPDTVVCRCEDLTLQALNDALDAEAGNIAAAKYRSRLSMGPCQGRNCLAVVRQMVASRGGEAGAGPRGRPPARPIPIAELLAESPEHVSEPELQGS